LSPPLVIIGEHVISSEDITQKLENLIIANISPGDTAGLTQIEEDPTDNKESVSRFKKISLFPVLFAGFADGVNPCAFSTIIFLISYLTFIKRKGIDILLVGVAFSATVFFTYFMIGLGGFRFIRTLESFPLAQKLINNIIAFIAAMLGCLSLWDYFLIKKGKFKQVKLKLADDVRQKIRLVISKNFRVRYLILASIVSGFVISLFEFTCTGQIYLPTLFIIGKGISTKSRAFFYLILYNLMFILPLALIFLAAFFQADSEKISLFFRKHLALTKLVASAAFFLMAIVLFVRL